MDSELDDLRGKVWALLEDVERRHPEITERGAFACPLMQDLAEAIQYFESRASP